MAEEPQVIRGINWRETFPFTHLFRAFRIAIHPSKLVLALLVVLALYLGGRVLDAIWASGSKAVPGEIALYEACATDAEFQATREKQQKEIQDGAARYLVRFYKKQPELEKQDLGATRGFVRENPGKAAAHVKYTAVNADLPKRLADLNDSHTKAIAEVDKNEKLARDAKDNNKIEDARKARRDTEQRYAEEYKGAYRNVSQALKGGEALEGTGLFASFLDYQTAQIQKVWQGVLANNWLGGLPGDRGRDGVFMAVWKFFTTAPAWAIRYHPLYFILYGAIFLVVWSLFGGAIARIAAVHVADEGRKLSVKQGLSFAVSKFLSFLSAPMIPLLIVVGIGVALAAVGALAFLIWIDALVGLLYVLALAGGFVMTLVLLGTIGGFNLMYPTIAVEGSDSFDAISRSFSYVYARPWRMLWYTVVSLAYGALTYLFVRLFIFLVLVLTHFFVGLLVFRHANDMRPLWDAIQDGPSWASLPYSVDWLALNWWDKLTAFFVAVWSYLAVAMLGAFAISMYFSLNTIKYYLMRREVDATEMDDVYLEQAEEEFAEAAPATTPAAAPVTAAAAATGAAVTATAGTVETPAAEPAAVAPPAPAPEPPPAAPAEPEKKPEDNPPPPAEPPTGS